MANYQWSDLSRAEKAEIAELIAAQSGTYAFPDFTGSGSPEGVVTADVGKSYVDTTNGALWFMATGNTDPVWVCVGGFSDEHSTVGFYVQGSAATMVSGDGELAYITDVGAQNGTGNAIYWNTGNKPDGQQQVLIELGPAGEFLTYFNPDGTTVLPGQLTVAGPIASSTHLKLLALNGGIDSVTIGDQFTDTGSGNGLIFRTTATDGEQHVSIYLGPAAEFATEFKADGSTVLPGPLTVAGDVAPDAAHGVVLIAPDATKHRLKVANDGTVTSEVVA